MKSSVEKTNKLRQSTGGSADLSTHRQSFSSSLNMKIQSVVFLTAVLILTTLVAETECITGPVPQGKREYPKKVSKYLLMKLIPIEGRFVRKPVNVNPGLNVNLSTIFSHCLKCFTPLTFGAISDYYSSKLKVKQYKQIT